MPAFALTAPVVPAEAVVLPVCAEAEVFGEVELVDVLGEAEAWAFTSPEVEVLPAVVAGPVAEADVPGAEAEVLEVVEAVPVCAAGPEAVVVLPGFVVAVLGLFVEVGEELTELLAALPVEVCDDDALVLAPLMSALLEVLELGAVLEAVVVSLEPLRLEAFDPQLPVARTLWPT
jgi:hypothetical protein